MHEMSIAQNLIQIIDEEMTKHDVQKLYKVKVVHGTLSHVVPEALETAFEVLTQDTRLQGAEFLTEEKPLRVKCRECGHEFSPEGEDLIIMTCPECKTEFGHEILSGKELFIEEIEAE
ncbi:MAG: hydrogenase maturation nickel metallochaperone HypA [Thermodesulfobacteriota bacterium]